MKLDVVYEICVVPVAGAGDEVASEEVRIAEQDVRISDLPGTTLGEAIGHTIWLDSKAAGWGWFVDATPWNDSEFTTAGDQGEQGGMLGQWVGDLLEKGLRFGPAVDWKWHVDAEGKRCAYVSVDATGVPQQGPGGGVRGGTLTRLINHCPDGHSP